MKHIIPVVLAVIIMALLLVSCTKTGDDAFATGRFLVVEDHTGATCRETIIVDTETNVMYLWVRNGYAAGLTPLLDGDGNVQFWNEKN
jgi:hypothetical protein